MINDSINKKFNKLTIIDEEYNKENKITYCKCLCDCGNVKTINKYRVIHGYTKSCGCLLKETVKQMGFNNKKYNNYNLDGNYGIGYASNTNKEFYFDLEDYDKIKDYCWRIDKNGYIVSNDSTDKIVKFHKIVMNNVPKNYDIDHIYHNKRDNRKENLRICTHQENMQNRVIPKNNTSGVIGVYWNKKNKNWNVEITKNKKKIKLGTYYNKEDAIKARIQAEKKYFEEFSNNKLN